jgi:hypothetical protein
VRSWCRHARVGPVVALVLVVGLVAGCGGSGGSPTGGASGGGGSTAASGDTTQQGGGGGQGGGGNQGGGQGGGGQGGGGGGQGEELAWVPFGPSDPTIPTPSWPAYRAFANGDCSALQDYLGTSDGSGLGDFGRAMVAVCQAAVEGRQDRWGVAAGLTAADPSSLANDCLAALVKDLLDRALAWHERHPGAKPQVRFQRLTGETECGRQASSETSETTPDTGTTSDTGSASSDTTGTQSADTDTTTGTTT